MKLETNGDTLRVSEVEDIGAATAAVFRDTVRNALDGQKNIEVDLSGTRFLDSCGLGALVSLYKAANRRQGKLRLTNPQPPVQQMLELTRMHRVFEVTRT